MKGEISTSVETAQNNFPTCYLKIWQKIIEFMTKFSIHP